MRIATKVVFDPDTFKAIPVEWYEYHGPLELLRGAESAAKTQLKTTNDIGKTAQQNEESLYNTVVPGYQSLMDTGYFNPQEQEAATNSEMGATAAPFKTAEFQNNNTAAATRNASDQTAGADQLALEEGTAAGQTAAELQQQKMQNQEAGLYGLGNEQSGQMGEAESMYGMGPSTINAWSTAQMDNPWLNFAGKLVGAAGQVGAAAVGGGGKRG